MDHQDRVEIAFSIRAAPIPAGGNNRSRNSGTSVPARSPLPGKKPMSLSSARNYALRAAKSQDQKEASELLSKAILELAASIEATDAKLKKLNKSS